MVFPIVNELLPESMVYLFSQLCCLFPLQKGTSTPIQNPVSYSQKVLEYIVRQ